jgi:hypothetical protein
MENYRPTTTDTPSEAEQKVHAAAYVLYFIGVMNLLVVAANAAFHWGMLPGIAGVAAVIESGLYLLLGYLVHRQHSATALGMGIFLVLLATAVQIYAAVVGHVAVPSAVVGLVIRFFLLVILFRAMPGAQALGPEA